MRTRTKIVAGAAAVATATALALSTAGAAGAAPNARAALAGSVPPWASSAAFKGAAAGTDHVGFRVYLGWRGGDAAARLATAVSTPGNALYGKFLTSAQFRAQFAPAQADVTAVQSWLRGAGFTVDYTPTNNHYVAAEGTVAQAAAAFGTSFGEYAVAGQVLRAPESTLTVPSSLAASVEGVIGLDESAALVHTDHIVADAPPSAGFRNAPPCSAYWNEQSANTNIGVVPYAPCGYTPDQIRGAYGLTDADTGADVTVAIIDAYASPTILLDANTYSARHNLPPVQLTQLVAPGTYRVKDNRAQSPSGWYGEETLDVEAVHTTAPGAKILYVGAPNNYQDLDAALNHVVDRHLASIVTNSYGWSTELLPRGYVKPYEDTIVQGAATGIGIYFSSGDNGDETGGNPANRLAATPDWPAVSPFVTAVGGTSLAVGAENKYLFETGWETGRASVTATNSSLTVGTPTYMYGSGGGTSRIFPQPWYQKNIVPDAIAKGFDSGGRSMPMRSVPDVSMLGDPNTGFLVGQTQTFSTGVKYGEYRIGGTSLSSPLMAGLMAVAQQKNGAPIGFANPALYSGGVISAVHDIVQPATTVGVLRNDFINGEDSTDGTRLTYRQLSFDAGLTIHTDTGYDGVTGIGSPTGSAFIDAVVAATP